LLKIIQILGELYVVQSSLNNKNIYPSFLRKFSSISSAQEYDIKLTFLGTGAPRPSPTRYGPSILLEAGETKILVDAGPGMRQRIFQAGGFELLTDINTVLITHLHFDHTIELPNLWLTGWLFGRKTNMKVYGPEGTAAFMDHFEKAFDWD
jgi:ribonuclease Z